MRVDDRLLTTSDVIVSFIMPPQKDLETREMQDMKKAWWPLMIIQMAAEMTLGCHGAHILIQRRNSALDSMGISKEHYLFKQRRERKAPN